MARLKSGSGRKHGLIFKRMQIVIVLFVLLAYVLYTVQRGLMYEARGSVLPLLSEDVMAELSHSDQHKKPECLLLWEDDEQSIENRNMMESTFSQIKVEYENYKVEHDNKSETFIDFQRYQTVVVSLSNLSVLGEKVLDLVDWVEHGGNLMFVYLPAPNSFMDLIKEDIGLLGVSNAYVVVKSIHFPRDFMLGCEDKNYVFTDFYESSLNVLLDEKSEVYMESAEEDPVPLIWRREYGKGMVVVCNLGYVGKVYRGIYASAYSLLGKGFAYPVINGSTFYIDDFPAPVPQGEGKYITRDYNMNVRDFMTQVWWPDIQELARKHGIRFTGLVIEQYSDETKGPFISNEDLNRFQYFGNGLLKMGGEIGFHGYNHMPLVLENFDYRGDYDSYLPWMSMETMEAGLIELDRFCASLFPDEEFQVYVPPSNILSEEGRRLLSEKFPQIKAIASTYLEGGVVYIQEFEVAEDGIVETPRVISGYIMEDFTQISAMAELNLHYVNTHFQHPDDVLDEERGAALGWKEMCGRLGSYMDWLYEAAPNIRNLTGIELAGAVQRYDALEVSRSFTEDALELELGGFVDEAWLMVRLNTCEPGEVKNGELEQLQEGLYLLKALDSEVTITLKDKTNIGD